MGLLLDNGKKWFLQFPGKYWLAPYFKLRWKFQSQLSLVGPKDTKLSEFADRVSNLRVISVGKIQSNLRPRDWKIELCTPFIIGLEVDVSCVLFLDHGTGWINTKTRETSTSEPMKNGVDVSHAGCTCHNSGNSGCDLPPRLKGIWVPIPGH